MSYGPLIDTKCHSYHDIEKKEEGYKERARGPNLFS